MVAAFQAYSNMSTLAESQISAVLRLPEVATWDTDQETTRSRIAEVLRTRPNALWLTPPAAWRVVNCVGRASHRRSVEHPAHADEPMRWDRIDSKLRGMVVSPELSLTRGQRGSANPLPSGAGPGNMSLEAWRDGDCRVGIGVFFWADNRKDDGTERTNPARGFDRECERLVGTDLDHVNVKETLYAKTTRRYGPCCIK